jgi:hypothetical protein
MTIKAVVFDLSDTTISSSGVAVEGIREAFAAIRASGRKLAVASNYSSASTRSALIRNSLDVDLIVGPDVTGVKKGSPEVNQFIARSFGCTLTELLYVGDNDKTDFPSCVNSGVLYLSARWANPNAKYGIAVDSPDNVRRFIERHLSEPTVWHWSLSAKDLLGRDVDVRSLIPPESNSSSSLDIAVLKRGETRRVGKIDYFKFLFRRVISALYVEGRLGTYDFWTFYPGHSGQPKAERYHSALDPASKIFRGIYAQDLIVRHATAEKSAYARRAGRTPTFTNQTNTIHLNAKYKRKLQNSTVLVVDDFCTDGNSFECSRNFLLAAGATKVDCISIGRYGNTYQLRSPRPDLEWNVWSPQVFAETDFVSRAIGGTTQAGAREQHLRQLML